ncbi:dual specificity protein phosphatase 3-like [Tubulanus polymorphus]|uniref:dual specificity protein phosphatase 3-like n=1 Tax=Tubulanus polymorphus TaxID=672921 RepID=UPI003DA586F4
MDSPSEVDYEPCSASSLLDIIMSVNPETRGKSDKEQNRKHNVLNSFQGIPCTAMDDFNEVYPGIYLGGYQLAKDLEKLKQLKITHVVNAAQGKKFMQIDTNEEFYVGANIKFMGICAMDTPGFKMSPYFKPISSYISNCLDEGGKVFVHCHQGISRSATIVLAFLMIEKNMTVQQACVTVRKIRDIIPNVGFRKELCELNKQLHGSTAEENAGTQP